LSEVMKEVQEKCQLRGVANTQYFQEQKLTKLSWEEGGLGERGHSKERKKGKSTNWMRYTRGEEGRGRGKRWDSQEKGTNKKGSAKSDLCLILQKGSKRKRVSPVGIFTRQGVGR